MLLLTDVFFAAVVVVQESTSPMLLPASSFAIHLFPKKCATPKPSLYHHQQEEE
jgi:hypothetical protein